MIDQIQLYNKYTKKKLKYFNIVAVVLHINFNSSVVLQYKIYWCYMLKRKSITPPTLHLMCCASVRRRGMNHVNVD